MTTGGNAGLKKIVVAKVHTLCYAFNMERDEYEFAVEKNLWLKENRGIGFEEVIAVLAEGGMLAIVEHPNKVRYSHQKMYVIEINSYVYIVPFVRKNKHCVFLKTIFKSRKMTKQYLGKIWSNSHEI